MRNISGPRTPMTDERVEAVTIHVVLETRIYVSNLGGHYGLDLHILIFVLVTRSAPGNGFPNRRSSKIKKRTNLQACCFYSQAVVGKESVVMFVLESESAALQPTKRSPAQPPVASTSTSPPPTATQTINPAQHYQIFDCSTTFTKYNVLRSPVFRFRFSP